MTEIAGQIEASTVQAQAGQLVGTVHERAGDVGKLCKLFSCSC